MTTPKRADRRAQIIAAAVDVFSEQGFERATTRAIARRAGVAEGTIFNYFATKREILIEILEHEVLETIPTLSTGDDAETVLATLLHSRLQMWQHHAGILRVMVSEAIFDEQFRDIYRNRIFAPAMIKLDECIQNLQSRGLLLDVNRMLLSRMMLGLAMGFGLMNPVAGEIEDIDGLSQQITQILLHGLSRAPDGYTE